jgi:RNA polymerase sigma factor (sigma-70 family)
VFQNVFASLIEKLDQIEHPDRIKAWLVTTARRETWRIIRVQRESFRTIISPETERDEIIELPDDAPLPDEVLLRLEQQLKLRDAVEGLDERCRKLLEMLFYRPEPPSYSDVAAALGLPEGSIGPTRARCLKKLLRALEKMGL